jgi:hypothetical protein
MFMSVVVDLPQELISLFFMRELAMMLSIASTLYALSNALGAVRMMQDLVWFAAELSDASLEKEFSVVSSRNGKTD